MSTRPRLIIADGTDLGTHQRLNQSLLVHRPEMLQEKVQDGQIVRLKDYPALRMNRVVRQPQCGEAT